MDDPSPIANICPTCGRFKPNFLPVQRPSRAYPEIIREVCATYEIARDDLLSDNRAFWCSIPRQALMFALHEAGYSYPRIGRLLGRDHSTIIFGVKRHRMRLVAGGKA